MLLKETKFTHARIYLGQCTITTLMSVTVDVFCPNVVFNLE